MAATPAPFCPQCGTRLQGSSRFCTNCGATIETHASSPTVTASGTPNTPPAGGQPANPGTETAPASFTPDAIAQKSLYNQPNEALIPPPPPPDTISNKPTYIQPNEALLAPPPPPPVYNPYATNDIAGSQSYTPPATYTPPITTPPLQSGAYQVPAYAQKQKGNRGCVITSVVLLLVLALGIGGVIYLIHSLAGHSSSTNNSGSSSTASSGSYNGTTPGTTPTRGSQVSSSEQLNLQFTYASVGITLISAQLAPSFSDDTNTTAGSAGIVRIYLRENNPTNHNPEYLEGEAILLLLPGGTTIQTSSQQLPISPDGGVNRTNWLDFPLNSPVALNQLALRVGTATQSQFSIPLQPNADLSKYQDKTSNLNLQFKYGNANMTLKTATLSYSNNDTQATTGNRYLLLTLAGVDNTTNSVDTYPSSYMRLQVEGNSLPPEPSSTFPYSIAPNSSASGTAVFLVPQGATSFTLVMLAQPTLNPPISQATQAFQIQ